MVDLVPYLLLRTVEEEEITSVMLANISNANKKNDLNIFEKIEANFTREQSEFEKKRFIPNGDGLKAYFKFPGYFHQNKTLDKYCGKSN